MLEVGAPVPYVQAQVGHEDPTTTLEIYAHVLKRRDRRRHGEAFDALMADAIPSAVNHPSQQSRPTGRPTRARHADASRPIRPQKRATSESVTSFHPVRTYRHHETLAICGAFLKPTRRL